MPKLIDRLHELGRAPQAPIGFGMPRPARPGAVMLLIGEIAAARAKDEAGGKAGETVDAFLLDGIPSRAALKALAEKIWGVRLRNATRDALARLRDDGCDFILVESEEAPALVLRDDGMARGFPIEAGLSEERARALDDLPFDYLTLDYGAQGSGLSLARLMALQTTVSMVGKHILLRTPESPPLTELELLRDLPVDAIVLDLSAAGADGLASAKEAIGKLEPRKPKGHRDSPLLPRAGMAGSEDTTQEDLDWDDDPDELWKRRPGIGGGARPAVSGPAAGMPHAPELP